MYNVVDSYFNKIDSEDKFEYINLMLADIGLTKEKIKSVDELIKDIADNATQKGFFNGVRYERDKGE
jgi:hypothetical protein